jgi:hypothetical protein
MEIYYNPQNKTLLATIAKENSCLSKIDYINDWSKLLTNVEVFKPSHLLIDAFDLCYRNLPEVECRFNAISAIVKPPAIALVMSNSVLGQFTLKALINKCPLKGHIIFRTSTDGLVWLNPTQPIFNNPYILE